MNISIVSSRFSFSSSGREHKSFQAKYLHHTCLSLLSISIVNCSLCSPSSGFLFPPHFIYLFADLALLSSIIEELGHALLEFLCSMTYPSTSLPPTFPHTHTQYTVQCTIMSFLCVQKARCFSFQL